MAKNNLQIKDLNGVVYELVSGIVLDDKFITREDFEPVFKEMLENREAYSDFNYNLGQAQKIIHIMEGKKGSYKTITEFTNNLDQISELFSKMIFKGLGGKISLFSTFGFGTEKQKTYFLMDEQDLPSKLDEIGQRLYLNSEDSFEELKKSTKKLKEMDEALKSHLRGFYRQLVDTSTQTEEDRIQLYKWASQNLKNRYKAMKKEEGPVTLAKYFWGKGKIQGLTSEAFATHLALKHPNYYLVNNHVENLKRSVISEHGGAGSPDLFSLLASAKGNTSSQLSGDVVLIDGNGNIVFNVQSKSSRNNAYNFTITYKKFLQNIMLFKEVYEKFQSNEGTKKDIDALFKAFSTNAWRPIQKNLQKNLSDEFKT